MMMKLLVVTTLCLFGLIGCGANHAAGTGTGGSSASGALTISGAPRTSAIAGIAYSFVPTVSGGTGGLTFSILSKPGWCTFGTSTGALAGTPSTGDLGTSSAITISVTDGTTTATLPPFMITVASSTDTSFVPAVTACSSAMQGTHATYDVGPGKTYADLSTVPWLKLQAGDVVNVYYRTDPYRTNIALKAQGTAPNPVIINGVTDTNCNRPVISGENATNALDQSSGYHDSYSLGLGTVLIWWGIGNYGAKPKFITIQNLEIVSSPLDSAGIYAVTVEDLLVQNCSIHDNEGWGVFTNVKNESAIETTYRVTIRGNRIYNNGVAGTKTVFGIGMPAFQRFSKVRSLL